MRQRLSACFSFNTVPIAACRLLALSRSDTRISKVLTKNSASKGERASPTRRSHADPGYVFRPIHYLGSKLRFLEAIESAINDIDPSGGPVCDLFSGSATVSRYLSRSRRVIAVDIQEYARVLADAVLNGATSPSTDFSARASLTDRRAEAIRRALRPIIELENEVTQLAEGGEIAPLCELIELGNLERDGEPASYLRPRHARAVKEAKLNLKSLGLPLSNTVCVRHFGGSFFSFAQAIELDMLTTSARETNNPVLLAGVLSTASHLVNSIGKQFAQPIRPRDKAGNLKRHVVKKILNERKIAALTVYLEYIDRYQSLSINRTDHIAIRSDYRDALSHTTVKPTVVYADPPYTRDHYSRFYHTLETIALGDEPTITNSNIGGGHTHSRGGYRAGRHQSPFCIKSQAPAAFSDLFLGVAKLGVPLALSYSGYDPSTGARPRVIGIDELIKIASRYFSHVRIQEIENAQHAKLNSSPLNKAASGTTEILLLCS